MRSDQSQFWDLSTHKVNGKLLLVLTEVDDLVYTGDQELVDIFEAKLKKKWNIQQSEPLRSFLGININYDREQGTIEFDVAEKIRRLFEEKPWRINQPKLESLIPPITARSYPLIETKHYASVVGACIYMAIHVAQTLLMPLDVSPERCSILVLTTHEESSPYCNTWIGLVHTN